jgi:hypothetical protein
LKVAIVHDWLTGMRGGERCLEVLCELFPKADIYTLVHLKGTVSPIIERHPIFTSIIQRLPFSSTKYRYYLPFFPLAIELFDLRGYDLIISSSHCVAKGIIRPPGTLHICYIHTPMRYAWDLFDVYFNTNGESLKLKMLRKIMGHLRKWDVKSCARVNYFIANSHHVADRVKKHYGEIASVIYPPVN